MQRIEIDTEVIKIIFRVNQNTRGSDSDAIAITTPATVKTLLILRGLRILFVWIVALTIYRCETARVHAKAEFSPSAAFSRRRLSHIVTGVNTPQMAMTDDE